MKCMAFFVEGQTEQIFVNRLIRYMLGPKNANIIQRRVRGGTNAPKQEMARHVSMAKDPIYHVLIVDCGADNRVKSEMLENLENLHENNYEYLIGLRDLFPLPLEEFESLRKGLQFLPPRLKKKGIRFDIVVAVREIETWFLAEKTHFLKVDKRLTPEFIQRKLGFNISDINPIERAHPAEDINKIYRLVGQSYAKKYGQTNKLIQALDIREILGPMRQQLKSLDMLVSLIEEFRDSAEGHEHIEY